VSQFQPEDLLVVDRANRQSVFRRLNTGELAERLGLARMRSECIHFGKWLSRLERLGATPDSQGT
jgi:hypothetical protein